MILGLALFSTIVGSSVGLGGGVIIKPALDSLGDYTLPTINLLSSSTIFVMSIVIIFYQLKKKDKINHKNTIVVAIGSIIGGIIGQNLISIIVESDVSMNVINNIQSIMLIILLLIVFIYMKNKGNIKSHKIDNLLYNRSFRYIIRVHCSIFRSRWRPNKCSCIYNVVFDDS